MALRLARIPTITEPIDDTMMLVDAFNSRIDEFNRVLQELELEHAKSRGDDGNTPFFNSALSLKGYRINNVGRSKDPQDVVTRRELEEVGILGSRAGGITLTGDLTVDGTITVDGPTGGGSEVTTGSDVDSAIAVALEAEVAASRDGEVFDREDAAGVNGVTAGTVFMGVDGTGKIRPAETHDGQIYVRDPEVVTLLQLLLEEVQKLNET